MSHTLQNDSRVTRLRATVHPAGFDSIRQHDAMLPFSLEVYFARCNLLQIRLCDALAGGELLAVDTELSQNDDLRNIIQCSADSQLQLIREGQHALDICVKGGALLSSDLCPSGSDVSLQEVALAIEDAVAPGSRCQCCWHQVFCCTVAAIFLLRCKPGEPSTFSVTTDEVAGHQCQAIARPPEKQPLLL